jgi:hypothetical protein
MTEKREPDPPLRRADHEVATGMTEPRMQWHFMGQAFWGLCLPANCSDDKRYEIYEAAAKLLEGIAPKDTAETMLAIQMVSTHFAAIEWLARAQREGLPFEERNMYLQQASKLSSLYTRQMEVLDKHRGKGAQKVTVEHVHVAAGGQAIVGQVDARNAKGQDGGHAPRRRALSHDSTPSFDANSPAKVPSVVDLKARKLR